MGIKQFKIQHPLIINIIKFIIFMLIVSFCKSIYNVSPEWWKWLIAVWTGIIWTPMWNYLFKKNIKEKM